MSVLGAPPAAAEEQATRNSRPGAGSERLGASRVELAVAGLLLLALSAAAYGSHAANGGFYYDDWANAANTHYPPGGGFAAVLDYYAGFTAYRPTLILYIPITHVVFGDNAGLHLAWAAALAALMSWTFYWLLRLLGLERVHAGAIAALVLLFPFSDSTRLWSTASVTHVAIALWLAGVGVAVIGLRAPGRRSALLHGSALALYLLSLWTYEITAAAIALTGVLYLTQAPWRRAVGRWIFDVGAVLASLLVLTTSTQNEALSMSDLDNHARLIAREGAQIIALAAVPFGTPSRWLICGAMGVVAVLAAVAWRTLAPRDPLRRSLARWVGIGVGGLLVAGAGWVVFVPAHWYYTPAPFGLSNRVNVLAAFGMVTLAYATLVVLGLLLARAIPRIGRAWIAVPLAGALVIGAGYLDRLHDDKRVWDQAAAEQTALLVAMQAKLPHPREHSMVLTFGWPGWEAPGVPIFASSWDLNGAVKMQWEDWTIDGFPVLQGASLTCARTGISIAGGGYVMPPRPYGQVYLLDVPSRRLARPATRARCQVAAPKFVPGPLYPPTRPPAAALP